MVSIAGCSTVAYYHQAIDGQLTILMRREPIEKVIAKPDTSPALKAKLERVLVMRQFAVDALLLPDNSSYTSYADLNRSYVVWNVFAAPELSLTPIQWCYPVAGCVSYRGYFSEKRADQFAMKLHTRGNDVYVAGISAYSTLGWFHDPILNTMLDRSETSLAGTLFHELAHQKLYVKNDTTFNESFAVAVELEGVRLWLKQDGAPDRYRDYLSTLRRKKEFVALVQDTRKKLTDLYQSQQSNKSKREKKQLIFAELKQDYQTLRNRWGGYGGYDRWFSRKLNNAHLVPIGSYYDYLPAFQALLQKHKGDLPSFYREAEKLAALPQDTRHARLLALVPTD